MKIHTSRLGWRIAGTLTGLGYLLVGGFSMMMRHQAPSTYLEDRALWMGLTFLIAGVLAVSVSWLVADLSNIWCRPPSRSRDGR